jgi:hypothetical protein
MTFLPKRLAQTVAAAAIAFTAMGAAGAAPASAAVSSYGGYAGTEVYCSNSMHWVRRSVTIRPQTGFASQSVAYRAYIQPFSGAGAWTNWTGLTAPVSGTNTVNLSGLNLTIYMEYAWWNGRTWTYAGEWITTYTQMIGTAGYRQSYCAV